MSISAIHTALDYQELGIGELMFDLAFYYAELKGYGITTDFDGGNTPIINYIIKKALQNDPSYYKQVTKMGNDMMDFFDATSDPDDDCYSELFDNEGVYELVNDEGYTEEEAYDAVGFGSSYDEKFPIGTTSSWRKRGIESIKPLWDMLTQKSSPDILYRSNVRGNQFRDSYSNTPTPEEIRLRQRETNKDLQEDIRKVDGGYKVYPKKPKKGEKRRKALSKKPMSYKRALAQLRAVERSKAMNEGDPAKGTGKKPKGSGRRLYTDENPKDTVPVKFRTKDDIQKTFSSAAFKSKDHKRQSQIINLVHQRVRAAYQNAKDPEVKKRLKKAYDYAKERKEASKQKTKRMNK